MKKQKPILIIERAGPTFQNSLKKARGRAMPSNAIFNKKVQNLEKRWDTYGAKIIIELNKVTKLKWKDDDIRCYLAWGIKGSFSHPLTLSVDNSVDELFDVLTHELIHRLLNNRDHPNKFKKKKADLLNEYKNESKTTQLHILVHALHSHILKKFFSKKRLVDAMKYSKRIDYIRSWKIVNDLGHRNIIDRVFK